MKPLLPTAYLFFSLCFTTLTAQNTLQFHHACAYAGDETEKTYYEFDASREADSIVTEILNAVSLEKNFVIKSSNCNNALATAEGGQRYILYNTTFLEKFKADAQTRWAAYAVFAHEIGHHLQGHDFSEPDPAKRKRMELEADKFSGGVLRMLGACLADAQAGIATFALDGETATHPSAAARREAIASGWKKKDEQLGTPCGGSEISPAPAAADLTTVSARLYTDITQFEDKLKNITRFLPSGDRMFEYPDAARQFGEFVRGYNAARDSVFAHRQAFTADFKRLYARDEPARSALAEWYRIALDDVHDRYLLPLDTEVQGLFSDVEKEKISVSKARRRFREHWSADSPLSQNLQGRVTDLEEARKRLQAYLKL